MAVYNTNFTYKNHTPLEFGLIAGVFNPNNGESDSFLTMEASMTPNFDGTKNFDYGAKYSSVATLVVSLIKSNNAIFTVEETRSVLKWLTGTRVASELAFYDKEDNIIYSFLGRFVDVKLQKMDARIIGIVGTFTATSPWAYSAVQTITKTINGTTTLSITNSSDDEYTYIYPNIVFTNGSVGGNLSIQNTTLSEETLVTNIVANEVITMSGHQIILSDKNTRIFGSDFNFRWLRLQPGVNSITVTGNGSISIQYRNYLKVADALVDIENTYNDSSVPVWQGGSY